MMKRRHTSRLTVVLCGVAVWTIGVASVGAADDASPVSAVDDAPVAAPRPLPLKITGRPVGELHQRIDELIARQSPDYEQLAAPLADDAEFLRRVTLDLTGKIPSVAETRAFLADPSSDKRQRLIDRLLDSPEYARHMQRTFDVLLMRRLPAKAVSADAWQKFLRESFAVNKPWDQLTREILDNDGTDPNNRGPARFYLDRNGEVDEITRDIGRVFLGANLECAQCHDHPEVSDWEQSYYYGISAFLVRSFLFTDAQTKVAVLAEKGEGEVSFESVFEIRDKTSKGAQSTRPRFFDGPELEEPMFKKGEEYIVAPAKNVRPIPKFSRRAQLGAALTAPENLRFARTLANRLWAHLLGYGIVHPLEYDHSDNPPSHPELLDLLTQHVLDYNYDIKYLLREIALSETYQRSSRQPAGKELAPPSKFAQAQLKPLTPAQFAWAILEASGEAEVHRAALKDKLTEEALFARLASVENRFESLFAPEAGALPRDFDATADQTLFLSNDPLIQGYLTPKPGNLSDRLRKLPADDHSAIADELFLSVLCRPATPEDVQDVRDFLTGLDDARRPLAIEQLIWAVMASAEFRFNH